MRAGGCLFQIMAETGAEQPRLCRSWPANRLQFQSLVMAPAGRRFGEYWNPRARHFEYRRPAGVFN
jgi:hypothetical protein